MTEMKTAKATAARVKKGKEHSEGILMIIEKHPAGVTLYQLSRLYKRSPGATLGAIKRIADKITTQEVEKNNRKLKYYFSKNARPKKISPELIRINAKDLDVNLWKYNASVYGLSTKKIQISPHENPNLKKFLNATILLKKINSSIEFVLPKEFIEFYELRQKSFSLDISKDKIIITLDHYKESERQIGSKKILIIDDEDNEIIKNIKDVLEQKHKLDTVNNIKDAKIEIKNEKPDFMILDWTSIDSPEEHDKLLEYLTNKNKNARAIIITGHPYDSNDVDKEIRKGFTWFYSKHTEKLPEKILSEMSVVF